MRYIKRLTEQVMEMALANGARFCCMNIGDCLNGVGSIVWYSFSHDYYHVLTHTYENGDFSFFVFNRVHNGIPLLYVRRLESDAFIVGCPNGSMGHVQGMPTRQWFSVRVGQNG